MPPLLRAETPVPGSSASAVCGRRRMAVYAGLELVAPWRAGRSGGLTFGTIAALVFLLDGLYPLRRRLLSWPLGTAQRWLQLHIYGGVLAMLFVFIHVGFACRAERWAGGCSGCRCGRPRPGLLGVDLQKWIPHGRCGHAQTGGARASDSGAHGAPPATRPITSMRGASDRLLAAYRDRDPPALRAARSARGRTVGERDRPEAAVSRGRSRASSGR